MKIVTRTYAVYSFDELSELIKSKVVDNTLKFFLECYDYENMSENMQKAIDKSESMKTPWFAGSYIWEYAQDEILSECKAFDYLVDGTIFNEDNNE